MPKAYWIVHIEVTDAGAYESYRGLSTPAVAKFGGTFIVRGGPQDVVEGQQKARSVVVEFPDLATARACYDSEDYAAARAVRGRAAVTDFVIINGWDG